MPGIIRCLNCKSEVPAGAKFCPQCAEKIPSEQVGGFKIGAVGLRQAGTIHSDNQEKTSGPAGDYCQICGLWVKTEDSFRCKMCGRASLHLEHRQPQAGICSECAAKLQLDLPPANSINETPKKQTSGNRRVIPLGEGLEMEFVRIPAGAFLMGSAAADEDVYDDEKPQHMVSLKEYWLGKTPVTNAQYQVFVKANGLKPPQHWKKGNFPIVEKDHPVVEVSWLEASAFCEWVSAESGQEIRLPSEAEWEKAARGTDGRKYPWGQQKPDVDLCNYGNQAGKTTRVGRYSPAGDSPYGCVDMAGNAWEWTSTVFKEYPYSAGDGREDPDSEDSRVLRGGSWGNFDDLLRCAARYYYVGVPDLTRNPVGFRCARSAP
jgi:formylglycine-generating enzyme required for sulfatase activity